MIRHQRARFIAIDVRASRIGFAVFERHGRLWDWGRRAAGPYQDSSDPITGLFDLYQPSFVVLRKLRPREWRDTPRTRAVLRRIRSQARIRELSVISLAEGWIRERLGIQGRGTKHEAAKIMASYYPELAMILPNPRKCYMPEDRRMSIFDAASLGAAFTAAEKSASPQFFRRPPGGVAI